VPENFETQPFLGMLHHDLFKLEKEIDFHIVLLQEGPEEFSVIHPSPWLSGQASENYTCMHMTLNFKRHINFLIRHIIY